MVDAKTGGQIINDARCGDCGSVLVLPWNEEQGQHTVRCLRDPSHKTIRPKKKTRTLYNGATKRSEEYDIMSQQPIDPEEPVGLATRPEKEMMVNVQRALSIGLFPQNTSMEQQRVLAKVATAYGLDPLMGELIPYQGRPYITIAGRRRLDAAAGHRPGIKYRFLTPEEEEGFKKVGALSDGDLVQVCILSEAGREVEGYGRALESESKGNSILPLVSRRIEMAQKRAERRARETAYGPVPQPIALYDHIEVMQEGDEAGVIEGTGQVVDETTGEINALDSDPQFSGICPHGATHNCLDCAAEEALAAAAAEDGPMPPCKHGTPHNEECGECVLEAAGLLSVNDVSAPPKEPPQARPKEPPRQRTRAEVAAEMEEHRRTPQQAAQ